ncbi:hypothetical protein A3J32_01300 [Candidatus Saccharibacteria bacterium RIFCSPLOWO2_02_FULL_46_7]|nr:MAG: hypothetical protein A3J32_01300 [Candidatus Saccharibacteria bacterium RIFCSPLOWO2_02_FULL_46_7]
MSNGGILMIIGGALSAVATILYLDWRVKNPRAKKPSMPPLATPAAQKTEALAQPQTIKSAKEDVEHIFNDEFREELRNRGRLHFEKIIGENAMFLQQDLRQTTTQLNDYMRAEITRTLQEEFKKYEQSIVDAKQIALDSIEKTVTTIEQQRQLMETQMQTQAQAQRNQIIARFEAQMAAVINHYLMQAIGNQIDLTDQLEFILTELENNKIAIIEDIKHGT